jgi:hypothetical protein
VGFPLTKNPLISGGTDFSVFSADHSGIRGITIFIKWVYFPQCIPDHPVLGSGLSLPSLLRLSTLRKLKVRDTHLGDPNWSLTPIHRAPEFPDPGSRYHMSPDFNRVCTECIVGNVGPALDEFSLNTALTREAFEKPKETPLCKLRKIYLTPLFPVENVVDTLAILSGSPVEELSVRCHEDNMLEMCSTLEDFLALHAERTGSAFYEHLAQIHVKTVTDVYDDGHSDNVSAAAATSCPTAGFSHSLTLLSHAKGAGPGASLLPPPPPSRTTLSIQAEHAITIPFEEKS